MKIKTTQENLWYILKSPTREMYSSKLLQSQRAQINGLMVQLKNLKEQEQTKLKSSKWQEIGAEINELETK